ncbi:hypothetical protein ABT382_33810 [Streptomyces pharetrae]|uniref:hypothetical protein n=1 Tax=Streptomyces pharetrae TaxID=291370 RepID=UPI003358B424
MSHVSPSGSAGGGPVRMGERGFHAPALGAQAGAMVGAQADDQRPHAEIRAMLR